MLTLLLSFCGFLLLILGAVVLYSNSKSNVNRMLAGFIFSGFLWLASNLFANIASSEEEFYFFVKSTLVGATLMPYFFLMFAYLFSNYAVRLSKRKALLYAIAPLAIVALSPTSLNATIVEGGREVSAGPLYLVLIPLMVGYLGYGFWMLIKSYSRVNKNKKAQLNYIFWGIVLSFIPGLVLNAVLPLVGYSEAAYYGPIVVIFFALLTTLAIVRHRLFNVRLIVARTVAYLLLLVVLGGLYGIIVLILAENFINPYVNSVIEEAVNIISALFLVLTFQPIKDLFDRITNKLFYRDAYDPQAFIDSLNRTLVNTVDIQPLLENSARIIEENIKAQYCTLALRETAYSGIRILGSGDKQFDEKDIEIVRGITPHIKHKVIVADELGEDSADLAAKLRKYDIAIMARLVATLEFEVEGAGYLLLGPKKSGNPYSRQDIKIIEIVANELVIAIQNALRFEEIEKFNITLQQKVDNATKELKAKNEQLKKMDETKDEFISMASHQLRTPLTSVKGYLSMVLEGDVGEVTEMQRKLLDQAFTSSQRMVYLIADLLNVSRLRTGKFVIEPIESNLAEVVEGEVGQLRQTAAGRGLALTYDKPAKFPTLYLDETKIRQVIMNFTDNAIYYTPHGGNINVKLEDKGETIEFTVNDDGMGVPKTEQPHLFSKFYRAGNAKKARPDGTGLGLFMAKKVIVAQGGSLIFRSTEGKGSTFGFTFPTAKLQSVAMATETAAAAEKVIEKELEQEEAATGAGGQGMTLADATVPNKTK